MCFKNHTVSFSFTSIFIYSLMVITVCFWSLVDLNKEKRDVLNHLWSINLLICCHFIMRDDVYFWEHCWR